MIGRWRFTSSRTACAVTGLSLLGIGVVSLAVGVWTRAGQMVDAELFSLVLDYIPASGRRALDTLARPLAPLLLAPVAALVVVIAIRRRRWGEAVTTLLLPGLIPVARLLREDVIHRPDLGVAGYAQNTFPSTHAAAGFVMVVAILVLWPIPPGRVLFVSAGFIAFVIGLGNVAWYAHRPVDVLGSAALVVGTALLLLALLPFQRWVRLPSESPQDSERQ